MGDNKSLRQKIDWLIREVKCLGTKGGSGQIPQHNNLQGLQGGSIGQKYHLDFPKYNCVVDICNDTGIGLWDNTPQTLGFNYTFNQIF
jgi:hypothetical protein